MKHLFSLAALSLLTAGASAQGTLWSQSTDNTTIVAGSISCLAPPPGGGITDNGYWRIYDPVSCGQAGDFQVNMVRFGVEDAADPLTGMQPIAVNIRDGSGGAGGAATAPILGTTMMMVPDTNVGNQTFEMAVFTPPVFVPAGTTIAIEVMAFNGIPNDTFFFIGSNGLGESDLSYLTAADCGVPALTDPATLGFPNIHFIIDVETESALPQNIGTNYCSPNIPNSTGNSGSISAVGSTSAAAQNVLLTASNLPSSQFGYFVASRTQGFVAMPGNSSGNLCVLGMQGRYNAPGQIGATGAGNSFSLQVGDINVPTNPAPGETISPGDTWNWQCWYRDLGNTNNFTDGLEVTFN